MTKKPANLIYGLDDKPPLLVLLLLGVQHIFLMSSSLVLPVVLVSEIGGSFDEVRSVVSMTMIACGIGTILQALNTRYFGSGFLCPNLCGPNFFAVSMEAAWLGGLPLMRGMTIVAGLVEAVFARVLNKIKFLFPPEITGLVVFMVAEGLIPVAVSKFVGINFQGEPIQPTNVLVAGLTLFTMVGVNVWSRGKLRLYSVLIGMATGYLLSFILGLISPVHFYNVLQAPWFAAPLLKSMLEVTFDWSLVPAFFIVSITGALKSVGNLIMCEKVNDEEWSAPDMKRIGNGLLADSACVAISGLVGGMASDTSASNVSLSSASGATSRRVAYTVGIMFVLLGFFPKIGGMLSVMPAPVMGAILIYVTCFMIMSGVQIILGAGVDVKKTFVIGLSMLFGLGMDILPALFVDVPYYLRLFFDSPLTLSTILAVILNQVLRNRTPATSKAT